MNIRSWYFGVPFVVGVATAATPIASSKPECKVAAEWVAAHRAGLPTTLSELRTYSLAYRKAIYAVLPRDTQRQLWHEQFGVFAQLPQLSEEQKAFVLEMNGAIDATFDGSQSVDAFELHFKGRAISILSGPTAALLMANLGGDPSASTVAGSGDCGCATGSDWCAAGQKCKNAACDEQTGCGTFWAYLCNGKCEWANPI